MCFHLSPLGAIESTKENVAQASPAQGPSAMRGPFRRLPGIPR
jgi:hypothetical protein